MVIIAEITFSRFHHQLFKEQYRVTPNNNKHVAIDASVIGYSLNGWVYLCARQCQSEHQDQYTAYVLIYWHLIKRVFVIAETLFAEKALICCPFND